MSERRGEKSAVRVGIATRNRASELAKAIDSAYAQTYRPLVLEVHDDASTDETFSIRQRYPAATWYRSLATQGCWRARNHMMLKAREAYYASLDDDAWFMTGDELEVAVAFLDQNPEVAAVAFDILSPDRPDPVPRGRIRPAAMFIGCGHVLRLSVVNRLGGYAEAPGPYGGEEKDLCLRLLEAGYQVVRIEGLHVWHNKSSQARDADLQHASGVCNDLVFELRRCPSLVLPAALVWKVIRHLAFAVGRGLLRACWRGIWRFLWSFRTAWRGRQPVRLSIYRKFLRLIRDESYWTSPWSPNPVR